MHLLRRNLDCQFLLFNNEIYGLTKGQYSPTSRDRHAQPVDPVRLGRPPRQPVRLRARRRARGSSRAAIDVNKNLPDVLKAAHAHQGASFVEIFQNCVVYNDDVFADFTDKGVAADKQLWLKAGEKMLFAGGTKGIALDTDDADAEGRRRRRSRRCIVHDPRNRTVAHMLVEMPAALPGRAGRDLRRPRADLRQRGDRAECRGRRGQEARPPGARRARARPGRSRRNRAPNDPALPRPRSPNPPRRARRARSSSRPAPMASTRALDGPQPARPGADEGANGGRARLRRSRRVAAPRRATARAGRDARVARSTSAHCAPRWRRATACNLS